MNPLEMQLYCVLPQINQLLRAQLHHRLQDDLELFFIDTVGEQVNVLNGSIRPPDWEE